MEVDTPGSFYGFDFRGYRSITDLQQEDGQFDVIGHVIACEDLDMYDKNGKSGKKKPLTLVDHEYGKQTSMHIVKCVCTQQFNDFLNTCDDHGKIILVMQLAMMKIWDAKMCVQNGYNATKLFLFDVAQPIVNDEFQDVKEYSSRLFAREDVEKSENTSTRISMASKNSTKETFVGKNPPRNIAELLDVAHKLPPVFTVLRLSDDPEILDSIRLAVTPSKQQVLHFLTSLYWTWNHKLIKRGRDGRINVLLKMTSAMNLRMGRRGLLK
ncbi:hypothetical protein Tco_1238710 [Tanacetum coccineum]